MKTLTKKSLILVFINCLFASVPNLIFSGKVSVLHDATVSQTEIQTTSSLPAQPMLIDSTDCKETYVVEVERDFVPVLKCSFFHYGIDTYALPLFADIDGDGETEVVVTLQHSPDGFVVVNPNTCEEEYTVAVAGDVWMKDGGPVLGDVDHDGFVDIFMEVATSIQRFEYNPASNEIEMVWSTPPGVSNAARSHLDIWDLNQDGEPELIPNMGQMVNAVTGYVYPGALPVLHYEAKGLFAFTADADPGQAPEGQGNVELIYGTHMYRYDFINEAWVLVKKVPDLDWGYVANVSLGDMDLDGDVDAVMSSWDDVGQALIWDLQTNELLGGGVWDYPGDLGSRINIANMDQDEYPEMVLTSRFKVFAVDDIVNSGSFGNVVWLDETSDESGHTQLTSFDFDGNGTYEVAYRDETRVRIFSGMGTGEATEFYPSTPRVLLDSGNEDLCESYTGMEYPTIGDVDGDNEAEILATCHNYMNVYESGSLPWGNASKVWNTQAFNVTCVNQDGTIPAVPVENYTIYNNFLAQVNTNEPWDTITFATPDGFIQMTDIDNDCSGVITVNFEVCNQGEAPMAKNTPISFYWSNPTTGEAQVFDVQNLPEALEPGDCYEIQGTPVEAALGTSVEIFGVINDPGISALPYSMNDYDNGGDFPLTGVFECDYSNNLTSRTFYVGTNATETITESICEGDVFTLADQTFDQPGTYEISLTSDSGCDSLVTLNLSFMPAAEAETFATICEGETFNYNGQAYTESGTFTSSLANENGCDSIFILHVEVLQPSSETMEAIICEGSEYNFNGQVITTPGTYTSDLQSENGCDSTVTLVLNTTPAINSSFSATICPGESYILNDTEYTAAGEYVEVFQSTAGCDSTVTLVLDVIPVAVEVMDATICAGETYDLGGQTYTETGIYTQSLQGTNGCDSLVTLNLEVLAPIYETQEVVICQGSSFTFGGQSYSESGSYAQTFTTAEGCEGTITLVLNVMESIENNIEVSICEGEVYNLGGTTYSTPGTYTESFTASAGCDSIVNLTLQINEAFEEEFITTICEGEEYNLAGQAYNVPGTYTQSFTTASGCDSTVTFTLEIESVPTYTIIKEICQGQEYRMGASLYSVEGSYTQILQGANGCDSIMILDLIVYNEISEDLYVSICPSQEFEIGGEKFSEPGTHTKTLVSSIGCDSVVTVHLSHLPEIRTTAEMTICDGESVMIGGKSCSTPGTYEAKYQSALGCDSIVTVELSVLPEIKLQAFDALICYGETVELKATGGAEYSWYPATGLSCTDCPNPKASPKSTTVYTVSTKGCLDRIIEKDVTVEVKETPELYAQGDVMITPGESAVLTASSPHRLNDMSWTTYDELVCEACPEVTVSPMETTDYFVHLRNENNGCVATDTVRVEVRTECVQEDFFFPNMISPNGDGVNDFFYVEATAAVNVKHLRIYDRWGEKVFATNTITDRWDGTFRDQPLNPGVYVYYLEVVCPNGEPYTRFGNVTIVK